MTDHLDLPAVTCLCPTYGRFSMLRESLACFLAQDYPGEKKLLVLNDAEISLPCGWLGPGVHVLEMPGMLQNLGEKRQALLEMATTPLVAHWDDDDLYLPWHLSDAVRALRSGGVDCVKVRRAWEMKIEDGTWRLSGTHDAGNDGSMVFSRDAALALGGYPRKQVGQNIVLLRRFQQACLYAPVEQGRMLSVAVRRTGAHNFALRDAGAFRRENRDFGDGRPLTPGDLRPLWRAILEGARERLSPGEWRDLELRLRLSLKGDLHAE